jgi:hypothetical protein
MSLWIVASHPVIAQYAVELGDLVQPSGSTAEFCWIPILIPVVAIADKLMDVRLQALAGEVVSIGSKTTCSSVVHMYDGDIQVRRKLEKHRQRRPRQHVVVCFRRRSSRV